MMVLVTSPEEYFGAFPMSSCVYGSREFFDVTPTADDTAVRYFVGYEEGLRPKIGIVAAFRDGKWVAPFSAPFAEIAFNKAPSLERIYDFISELTDLLNAPLEITLAPDFYAPDILPKISGVLANYASSTVWDFDYYYPLDRFMDYMPALGHAARKNLARAQKAGFEFSVTTDIPRAYAVIQANRESHRYSLAMSLDRVIATVKAVKADFFLLSLGERDVAAAMVYHVAKGIVQVIYWGDVPGYSEHRPMNLLAYNILRHYAEAGIDIVDIGPSSTKGIPNAGLCRFKESIGCLTALKPTFRF